MTYPAVGDLPEDATSTLLGVCAQLSRSRHPGLARWASSVSDALLLAGAEASDDEAVVQWCTRMNGLIVADLCRRELNQLAIDAKAAAIVAEERRLGCLTHPMPDLHSVPTKMAM
jgi:hypothetical protein